MKTFNFEIGKKFSLINGVIATVVDIDFGGYVLLKYNWYGDWKTLTVDKSGFSVTHIRPDYNVVSEKLEELQYVHYHILYVETKNPKELRQWSITGCAPTDIDIENYKKSMGDNRKFYGVQKVVLKSDGTKDKINF